MDLKEIASVKGRSGLFNVLKSTRTKVVLRSLDSGSAGLVAVPTQGVTLLDEVSIYTRSKEDMVPLREVLQSVWEKCADTLTVDVQANDKALRAFMKSIVPEYDEERVYVSDIKKLIKWYDLLLQGAPEAIKGDAATKKEHAEADKETSTSPKGRNKEKKPGPAKKAAKPAATSAKKDTSKG